MEAPVELFNKLSPEAKNEILTLIRNLVSQREKEMNYRVNNG